jgi:23S rRNA pseudouridine1911/1915/1917 synthase
MQWDNHCVVEEPMLRTLHKPAGLPVFPPHDDPGGDCVLTRLLREEPARRVLAWPDGFDGGIAHRLDVGTSGALAVADDPEELQALRGAFASKNLVKTYRFLTHKHVPWQENECDRAIAHDRRKRHRMVVQRGESTPHRGRWHEAHTAFTQVAGGLWQAQMRTGVMHQIRAHAAFLGLALAGDPIYGGGEAPEEGAPFCLHHVGFTGPDGWDTQPVPTPAWATPR